MSFHCYDRPLKKKGKRNQESSKISRGHCPGKRKKTKREKTPLVVMTTKMGKRMGMSLVFFITHWDMCPIESCLERSSADLNTDGTDVVVCIVKIRMKHPACLIENTTTLRPHLIAIHAKLWFGPHIRLLM